MCTLQLITSILINSVNYLSLRCPCTNSGLQYLCTAANTIATYNISTRSRRTSRLICSMFHCGFARERMSYSVTEVQPNLLFIMYNLHSFPWKCFQLREVTFLVIHFLGQLFLALPYCSHKCLQRQCHSMCTSL